jgi:hypothetical protein
MTHFPLSAINPIIHQSVIIWATFCLNVVQVFNGNPLPRRDLLAGFVRCHYSCVFTSKQPNRADKKARCKVFAAFENCIHYILYKIQGFYLLEIKKKILHIIPSHRLFEFAYKGLFGFGLVVLKLCGLKKLIILKCGQ